MPLATPAPEAPWVDAYATATAEAVSSALDLQELDEVHTDLAAWGARLVHTVDADPPRRVRALAWTRTGRWAWTGAPVARARWSLLDVDPDCEPLELAEAVHALARRSAPDG